MGGEGEPVLGVVAGGGVLAWVGVVVGDWVAGAAVVVGAGLLWVVTAAAAVLDLCAAFLCVAFLCVLVFFVVVAAGFAFAACFAWLVVVDDDPPQAASPTAATIAVTSVRFMCLHSVARGLRSAGCRCRNSGERS